MKKAGFQSIGLDKIYLSLESEANSVLEEFLENAGSAKAFSRSLEKVEGQIGAAGKLSKSQSELDLNESLILSEAIDFTLVQLENSVQSAVLVETQDEWAEEFEDVKGSLDRLFMAIGKVEKIALAAGASGTRVDKRRAAMNKMKLVNGFKKNASECKKKITGLRSYLNQSGHKLHSRLSKAKKSAVNVKAEIKSQMTAVTKRKVRKKIDAVSREIKEFIGRTGQGRIFADHKHLAIVSGNMTYRVPMTSAVRFSISDMASSVEGAAAQLGRNGTMIVGSYSGCKKGSPGMIRIGTRTCAGDSFVFKERMHPISL